MTNERLNTDRCFNISDPDRDDAGTHRWRALPYVEQTEHGPIAWWCCERCPARTLFDHEQEDHMAAEPIVVYPPSCFEPAPRCNHKHEAFADMSCQREVGHAGEHCPVEHCPRHEDEGVCGCPRKASGDVVHVECCVDDEVQLQSAALMVERFGTPIVNRAVGEYAARSWGAGDPIAVNVEARRRAHALKAAEDNFWPGDPLPPCDEPGCTGRCTSCFRIPEPASIVHPPTDPAPPSDELRAAIEDAYEGPVPSIDPRWTPGVPVRCPQCKETACAPWCPANGSYQLPAGKGPCPAPSKDADEDEDPPTLKRPTPVPVESGASAVCEPLRPVSPCDGRSAWMPW